MADPFKRKQLEYRLQALLRSTEEEAMSDPKIKSMIEKLRHDYSNESQGFMYMIGAGPTPKKHEAKQLPKSKIPQLLMILDAVATKKPLEILPSREDWDEASPPSLINHVDLENPRPSKPTPTKPADEYIADPKPARNINIHLMKEIQNELNETKQLFKQIKSDEPLVKNRAGKYALVVERLKAERVLREYPEKINHLEHKKQMIEEGILS